MASYSLKRAKCAVCGQTADPREMVGVKRKTYHEACFKCFHAGCNDISPTNCAEIDDILYCDRHFDENIDRHLFCAEDGECFICHQPVYLPEEKLIVSGLSYQRACFKCCHGCPLSQSDHEMFEGALYCSEHKMELPDEYDGVYTKVYNLPELIKKGICTVLERPPRGRGGGGGGGGGASSSGPEA